MLKLKDDSSVIAPIQKFGITPSYVPGTAVPPSSPQKPRSPAVAATRHARFASKRVHQRFSANPVRHALGAVNHAPLFEDLSPSALSELADEGQESTFSHNENIFAEGDPLRSVSIVTSGHAKTIRHSAAGKIMILDLPGPGDVLDGLGSLPGSTHLLEARALKNCRVFSWDVARFESLSNKFPALRRNSTRLLLGRLRVLEARVHELATERVPQRLAKILLRLLVQNRGFVPASLADLTGEDLAQMVGTTQFTVSRLLCDWAAQRIIQPGRTAILVENLPGLIAIAMQIPVDRYSDPVDL